MNAGGTNYNLSDTVTVTNPNAGKVLTFNLGSLVGGTGYTTGTALATTGGSGSASLTVDITASGGAITNITINDGGTGYVAAETITVESTPPLKKIPTGTSAIKRSETDFFNR